MKVYLLVGWSLISGETVAHVFSTEEKRTEYFKQMEDDAKSEIDSQYFWNHNWHKVTKDVDPGFVRPDEIAEDYDTTGETM